MPLYEYTCTSCKDEFTLLQSVHVQPGETACPSCGTDRVEKKLSVFAPSVPAGGGSGPLPGGCPPMGGCGGGACGI